MNHFDISKFLLILELVKKEIIDILHSALNYNYTCTNSSMYGIWCDNVLINIYQTIIIISPYNEIIHYDEFSDINIIIFEIGKHCPSISQYLRNEKLKDLLK